MFMILCCSSLYVISVEFILLVCCEMDLDDVVAFSCVLDLFPSEFWRKLNMNWPVGSDVEFDWSALSLLPSYVEILKSFLENRLLPKERLSFSTHLCLLKLQCLSDALWT